ncbi:hypothetical protein AC1031_014979 [Aphanomyces cochlioides]|nr:hypothetical protein AC1031_014979 [Aphanomyces cochlioides]
MPSLPLSIVKICCQVTSSLGALYMLLSLRNSPTVSSKILCLTAISDFIFSMTGALATIAVMLDQTSWPIQVFLAAPHWGFEIASFLWTGTLVVYILSRQANVPSFALGHAHAVIWVCVSLYICLESYVLVAAPSTTWKNLARVIWDTFAILTLATVLYGLCAVRAHKLRTGQLGQSVIVGKLIGYMLLFIACVTPNITNDIFYFAYPPHEESELDVFTVAASTMFSLWPLGTSLVFASRFSCFSSIFHPKPPPPASARALASPTQELVGLEIGPKIGQGLAVVYKGIWRGAVVAVKMRTLFVDEEAMDPQFVNECNMEIQEEALVMKRLTHPNIVLFMEAGFYRGSICIVSEYCSRGSLRDVLRTPLVWPMKIRLALGLAYGLQYLHNSRMIHRDLKSPNILVDETWHAKIADFGTLRLAEIVRNQNPHMKSSVNMTGLVGTTRWMAPEVIQSKKLYTEKIDIYSLGVILWELIDGKELPYDNLRWNHEIEQAILDGKRPEILPNTCPPRWKVLVKLCWQVEPTERPSIGELIRSLQRLAVEDIKDIRHQNVPFVGNLQQMDCDYILKYTRCDVDYDTQQYLNTGSTHNIALLEEAGSSVASHSTIGSMYTM